MLLALALALAHAGPAPPHEASRPVPTVLLVKGLAYEQGLNCASAACRGELRAACVATLLGARALGEPPPDHEPERGAVPADAVACGAYALSYPGRADERALLSAVCEQYGALCGRAADLALLEERSVASARPLAERGCREHDAEACDTLAGLWLAPWADAEVGRAAAALDASCRWGNEHRSASEPRDDSACYHAQTLRITQGDAAQRKEGLRSMQRLALRGHDGAARTLAAIYWGGANGVPPEAQDAWDGCQPQQHTEESCAAIGTLLEGAVWQSSP